MKNITVLRSELADNFAKTKSGAMGVEMCKELSNNAGKIVGSLKVELEYNKFMGNKIVIPFLQQG